MGAHYREGFRAKSDPDFVNKIQGALQELEETAYWLELLQAAEIIPSTQFQSLYNETNELIAMFTTMQVKVKSRL